MQKRKTVIIVLLVLFVLVGGGGGYLLWRVNQEETVAPTDSDAAAPTDCTMAERTIDFISGGEGKLERVDLEKALRAQNLDDEKAKIVEEGPSRISFKFQDSCKLPHTIKVTANEGYTFVGWEQSGLKLSEESDYLSSDTLTIPYKDISGSGATLRAVFKEDTSDGRRGEYTLTYDVSCPPDKAADMKNDLLECKCENSSHEIGTGTCFIQTIAAGGDSCPVEVKETEQCKFSGCWEIDGEKVCSDSRTHQIRGIEKSTSVVALFDNTSTLASLKYDIHTDSKSMGILKVDGTNASSYPVDAGANVEIKSIEAVPNIGFEFDTWEATGASLENLDLARRDVSKDRINRKILLVAKFKAITPAVLQYELKYETGEGGKLSKDGGASSTLPISVTLNSGENGPSVKAIPNTGYKFVHWIDSSTGEKDTSALVTSNPRKDTNVTKNISLKAYFETTGTAVPPKESVIPDIPVEPVVPAIPEEPKSSVPDSITPGSTETMPETAALPDKSLYIMTIGTLILCLGMIWQYIPFKKFKLRK